MKPKKRKTPGFLPSKKTTRLIMKVQLAQLEKKLQEDSIDWLRHFLSNIGILTREDRRWLAAKLLEMEVRDDDREKARRIKHPVRESNSRNLGS